MRRLTCTEILIPVENKCSVTMADGVLISVEGIDGSGTTTITNALSGEYPNALVTEEPTDTFVGKVTHESIDEASPFETLCWFAADRWQHVHNEILPALRDGRLVIVDRYAHSTLTYQAVALSEAIQRRQKPTLKQLTPYVEQVTPVLPNFVLFVDDRPDMTSERTDDDCWYERDKKFQRKVSNLYRISLGSEFDDTVQRITAQDIDTKIRNSIDALDDFLREYDA